MNTENPTINLTLVREAAFFKTRERLDHRAAGNELADPDLVFADFTELVGFSISNRFPLLAIDCWAALEPVVAEAEIRLKATNPAAQIHKGSPIFNVALCHFHNGDLENTFHFLARADEEDRNLGGQGLAVRIGGNPVSKRLLIDPIIAKLAPSIKQDYQRASGTTLDSKELIDLLSHVAKNPIDAIQTLSALLRFTKATVEPENDWNCFLRTRALGELLNALESTLHRHQGAGVGTLHNQMEKLYKEKPAYNVAFYRINSLFDAFVKSFVPPLHNNDFRAVNWAVERVTAEITSAIPAEERAGLAGWLACRLRNGLLHILDSRPDIYTDKTLCTNVFGLVLGVMKLAKKGENGEL